jgi:predicted transposase/invertase (TIGR01784 family)
VVKFLFFEYFFPKKLKRPASRRHIQDGGIFMRNPVTLSPEDDIIDICRDNVFKAAFTKDTPPSQLALKQLLSAFIGEPVTVLTVVCNEPPSLSLTDRQIRFDIRVRFDQGKLANIEMTVNPRSFETPRLEYYAARLYSSQDIRGKDQDFDDLTPTYQLSLIGGKNIFEDPLPVHRFGFYDRENGVNLGGNIRIIVVELEKGEGLLKKRVRELSPLERWTVFFRYLTDPGKRTLINELLKAEEGIAMAGEVLLEISRDERQRAWLESEYKYAVDRQSDLVSARREGRAEGIVEGERLGVEKERREMARKLQSMGLSPEQIAEVTGLNLGD